MEDLSNKSEDRKAILKAYLNAQQELNELKNMNEQLKNENEILSRELEEKSSAFQNLLSFIQTKSE